MLRSSSICTCHCTTSAAFHGPPSLISQDADLILVEYSVNGCNQNHKCHSFMSPRVAAYETFLRRIIRTVPGAALLAVAAFDFELFDASMPDSQGQPTGISVTRPKAYFDSGESFHTRVAHRYGVPVASVRDALYDIFADDQVLLKATAMTRAQLLSPVRMIHPTTAGHVLFANVIWYTLQLTLETVMAAKAGTA